ncbi:hypothetical protein [Actinoplanes sp. L3-i22]|uniref:hypothetical protein n=1 Tax=Actinoplanes sp. L3-i22 TaxID=2836373 RepID=UPI001C84BD6D|nr:hypothetical protein [Actinoplanes sp. L3-i22]
MTAVQEQRWKALVEAADQAGIAAFLEPGPSGYGLGVCGHAWIRIRPASGGFARWLIRTSQARRDTYEGGIAVMSRSLVGPDRVPTLNPVEAEQSAVRHAAYAQAFAQVLAAGGVPAFAEAHFD